MKIIITLILLILFNEGYSQKTPVTVPEHYRLWLSDSIKISNQFKADDEITKRNGEAIAASTNNDAYIDSTNSYLTVRNKQVSVKIDLVTTAVIAKLPPIDLTAIQKDINDLKLANENIRATNAQLLKSRDSIALALNNKNNEIATLFDNTSNNNSRLIPLEQSNGTLISQIAVIQQSQIDTGAKYSKAISDITKYESGLNAAFYKGIKDSSAKQNRVTDTIKARLKKAGIAMQVKTAPENDLAYDYTNEINLWADKPKQLQ